MHKLTRIAAFALLAVAVLLAISALVVGKRTPNRSTAALASQKQVLAGEHRAIVATQDLVAGAPVLANQLGHAQRPGPGPAQAPQASDFVGKIPLHAIAKGSVIDRGMFAAGLGGMLLPGERALAVPVDELAGASNRIVPGDYVDVFLSLKPDRSNEQSTPQSRLLFSRLRVLAYGNQDLQHTPPATTASPSDSSDPRAQQINSARSEDSNSQNSVQARTALLAVPVEHANALFLGAQAGKLFLALRNPGDTALADASLFPQPLPVLRARAVGEGATNAQTPENAAYSGIDLEGLSGQDSRLVQPPATRTVAVQPSHRRDTPRASGIEIIRGSGAHQR